MRPSRPKAPRRLSRSQGDGRPAAPVALVHLGLGNFFRAHQAWYTEHSSDAGTWGYAAFSGRSADLAERLRTQDGLYTLVQRGPDGDQAEVVASLSGVYPGADHSRWLECVAMPRVAVITITVTEAGYCQGPDGGLDVSRADVTTDVARLRRDIWAPVVTPAARLVAGLAARRAAANGPLALVPCDNLPDNGRVAKRVVLEMAALVDSSLAEWVEGSVSVVSTVVDRITPRTGQGGAVAAALALDRADQAPVVTEPFSEWALAGPFPAGRPQWEAGGAIFTEDLTSYENRKLWLLNGAHSLLAYTALLLGHNNVAQAMGDDRCRSWVEQWWATVRPHLSQSHDEIFLYQQSLVERFTNPKMPDELARIAQDGSQKLPARVLPVLRAERTAGRLPSAATRPLAAWLCHLRGLAGRVNDVRADELVPLCAGPVADAARHVLSALDPEMGADGELVAMVAGQCHELCSLKAQPARP